MACKKAQETDVVGAAASGSNGFIDSGKEYNAVKRLKSLQALAALAKPASPIEVAQAHAKEYEYVAEVTRVRTEVFGLGDPSDASGMAKDAADMNHSFVTAKYNEPMVEDGYLAAYAVRIKNGKDPRNLFPDWQFVALFDRVNQFQQLLVYSDGELVNDGI